MANISINRKWAKMFVVVAFVGVAFSAASAAYLSTSTITTSSDSLGTVTANSVDFGPIVVGEVATKSINDFLQVTDIPDAYDASMRLRVYLLNADDLIQYYDYMVVHITADSSGDGGTTKTPVSGAEEYLTFEDAVGAIEPGIDFADETGNGYYLDAEITYRAHTDPTTAVAPQFLLRIEQS